MSDTAITRSVLGRLLVAGLLAALVVLVSPALASAVPTGVAAWGANENGQLGNGTQTNSDVPVAVSGLREVKAISGGDGDSQTLLDNGTVMTWGQNSRGQLGNATTNNSDVPVEVCAVGRHRSLCWAPERCQGDLQWLEPHTCFAGKRDRRRLGSELERTVGRR